jgi:type II secretory pathway component GspD/PulD (secretin)/tetratricopeptide (TPR) repeat protein
MVSRATKRFWKSMAIGLALSPASALQGPVWAQAPAEKPAVSAKGDAAAGAKPSSDVDAVRKLLQEGRKALAQGDKVRAEKLARQAQAMHVQLPFWETDSPEKLLIDIGVKAVAPAKASIPVADPKIQVKQGFEALRVGKLDEAQKLAQSAASNPKAKWGLFEDNPTKLLDEIQKARKTRDKEQSVKLLMDARKLYDQGKFAEARTMAYKASAMHGPYAMWDFGDRPEKLIADIDNAEAKNRKIKVPAVPNSKPTDMVASKTGDKTATPADKTAKPADKTDKTVKASDKAVKPNALPNTVAQQAKPPAPLWPSDIKTADVAAANPKSTGTGVTTAAGVTTPNAPSGVVPVAADPAKDRARALMAEGKSFWQAGRLVEARGKYLEAAQCRCEWKGSDETPDRCLLELSAIVMKQMDTALASVTAAVSTEQKKACEARLVAARTMAVGFGLDCSALDAKLSALKGEAAAVAAAAAANAANMIAGQTKLEKARMELRSGQCEMARQIATEVFNGQYGMQNEATQVLRSIDVEEHNQRVLAANRGYEAAVAAYRNRDFAQAVAIFGQVDANLLAADKKVQMREAVVTSQKQLTQMAAAPSVPAQPTNVVPAAGSGEPMTGVQTVNAPGITGVQGGMPKMTAPSESDSLATQVHVMQEIEYQRLRAEGLDVQSKAMQQFERGETDAALQTLDAYCQRVRVTKLDSQSITRLCRPVEAKQQSFRLLKAQKDDATRVGKAKDNFLAERNKEQTAEMKRQLQVKDLMKQFNTLYKEGKYKEAQLVAQKAHELDPDDPSTEAAVKLAEIHGAVDSAAEIQKRKDDSVVKYLNDAEDPGPVVDPKNPVSINPVMVKILKGRETNKNGISVKPTHSEKDKEIYSKLSQPVTVSFTNVPLRQALYDLQAMKAMNIHLDTAALASESVNPDAPVSLKVESISLKSALNLILDQLHLRYVVKDEVLKVTTQKAARGDLEQRVFSVADLVIPVDDYMMAQSANIHSALDRVIEQQRNNLGSNGTTPFTGKFSLQNGQPTGTPMNASMSTAPGTASMSTQPGSVGSPMSYTGSVSPTRQTMQDMLIKLVTNTIAPDTWSSVGGAGTIDYMPIGLALVVNQTPDVQEQVADLLDALRKLQDLEVSVEVRIITLAETFFERIGLDFALNIKTDHNTSQFEPQIVTNQFKPPGQVNDFSPSRFLAGIRPGGLIGPQAGNTGSFTGDLDIPIRSSSFQYAIPPFAYPNNPGFNGGLSMGLAFLSDIQVFMFMEAAQGDRRTNVMQAPKLTLFNGQTATINVSDQQFFVTNVNVVGFGGQIVFVPTNNPFPLGVQLAIQAVVSADRRFVRLNLTPTLSNIASAIVPLFPVTTFITPVFEGGAQGQPIPFTQFVQQPQISTVSIQTTVSIPDGGTVILGGLKTLSEGRNEFGPPVLSKLPYINRLFKNVGYGREAQSLLLMVTPRIIINSEEEERQTGVQSYAEQPR